MYCDKCGKRASEELISIAENYGGDYFCSEECRDKQRSEDDQYR
jgi:YHS domain-containing protein